MKKELSKRDHILREKVLKELNEDLHSAEKIDKSLDCNIEKELLQVLLEKDDGRRELASRAIRKLAMTAKGTERLIQTKAVTQITKLFDDPLVQIRFNAYQCLLHLAQFRYGNDMVVQFAVLPLLVDKLMFEKNDDVLVLVLTLLRSLQNSDNSSPILLKTQVLSRLNKHLSSKNALVILFLRVFFIFED